MSMPKKRRVLVQQPRLLAYRRLEFAKLVDKFDVRIVYSPSEHHEGFGAFGCDYLPGAVTIPVRESKYLGGRLFCQHGLLSEVRRSRPDIVFIQANVRYVSFWLVLIYCACAGICLVSHGQGLYRFPKVGRLRGWVYRIQAALARKYVCYNNLSMKSLLTAGVSETKLRVADNSLINSSPVLPAEKAGDELGVLFVGRLRERCGIFELIKSISEVRQATGKGVELHIVGGGEDFESVKAESKVLPWIVLYGPVYDDERIAEISRQCFVGVYPGDAGLSIVHFMSLSLPPVVHGEMHRHMGPEPDYIDDGINGFLFDRGDCVASLSGILGNLLQDGSLLRNAQEGAFKKYVELSHPGLGGKLEAIFDEL